MLKYPIIQMIKKMLFEQLKLNHHRPATMTIPTEAPVLPPILTSTSLSSSFYERPFSKSSRRSSLIIQHSPEKYDENEDEEKGEKHEDQEFIEPAASEMHPQVVSLCFSKDFVFNFYNINGHLLELKCRTGGANSVFIR